MSREKSFGKKLNKLVNRKLTEELLLEQFKADVLRMQEEVDRSAPLKIKRIFQKIHKAHEQRELVENLLSIVHQEKSPASVAAESEGKTKIHHRYFTTKGAASHVVPRS